MSLEVATANIVVFIYCKIALYVNLLQSGLCFLLTYHTYNKTKFFFFLIGVAMPSELILLGIRRRGYT